MIKFCYKIVIFHLSSHFASGNHQWYRHRDRHTKSNSFYLSWFDLQHRPPSLSHRRGNPVQCIVLQWWGSIWKCNFHLVSFQSPRNTFALLLKLFQVFLRLAIFPVVHKALLLVVGELFEAFCPSHPFQSAHCIWSMSKRGISSKCVDGYLEILIIHFWVLSFSIHAILFIRDRIDKKEKTIGFAWSCWILFNVRYVQRIAELTLKDGRFEIVTNCDVVHLR